MYILGEEAMVSNPQGSVAGGHVARSTGGHFPHSGHRHPSHHCGHTNLHGPQGTKQPHNPDCFEWIYLLFERLVVNPDFEHVIIEIMQVRQIGK